MRLGSKDLYVDQFWDIAHFLGSSRTTGCSREMKKQPGEASRVVHPVLHHARTAAIKYLPTKIFLAGATYTQRRTGSQLLWQVATYFWLTRPQRSTAYIIVSLGDHLRTNQSCQHKRPETDNQFRTVSLVCAWLCWSSRWLWGKESMVWLDILLFGSQHTTLHDLRFVE